MAQRPFLTVIVNEARALFALVSVALQVTRVRPSRNLVPDFESHVTGRAPSRSSLAVTRNTTRAFLAAFFAAIFLLTAPEMTGGVRSNSRPGTSSVPVHVSVPRPSPIERATRPLPEAPTYIPEPPASVK